MTSADTTRVLALHRASGRVFSAGGIAEAEVWTLASHAEEPLS